MKESNNNKKISKKDQRHTGSETATRKRKLTSASEKKKKNLVKLFRVKKSAKKSNGNMSPTHHHQQQRRNSVNANSDTITDGPWQCSTPLVRICTVGTINNVAGKDPHGKILYLSPLEGASPPREETGSLQVANSMRLVLLNVSLYVLVIKSLQETQ